MDPKSLLGEYDDAALNNNEAMTYRPACDPECEHNTGYEHTAMLTEMLTRLSKIK